MRQLITHNLGLKIVSFLIAVAIWYRYSLTSAAGVSQVFERRVKIVNKDPKLSANYSLEDGRVRITVAGRRLDLMQCDSRLEAIVDLKQVRSAIGEVMVQIEAAVPAELNLKVTNLDPKQIKISVRAADGSTEVAPQPPGSKPID